MKKGHTIETLTGIITASDWDKNDCVTEVMLSATDDEDYLIENGEKFYDLVHTPIQATGIIKKQRRDSKKILIKKYKIINESDM